MSFMPPYVDDKNVAAQKQPFEKRHINHVVDMSSSNSLDYEVIVTSEIGEDYERPIKFHAIKPDIEDTPTWSFYALRNHLKERLKASDTEISYWIRGAGHISTQGFLRLIRSDVTPIVEGIEARISRSFTGVIEAETDTYDWRKAYFLPSQIKQFQPKFRLLSLEGVNQQWLKHGVTQTDVEDILMKDIMFIGSELMVFNKDGEQISCDYSKLLRERRDIINSHIIGLDATQDCRITNLKEAYRDELKELYFDDKGIARIAHRDLPPVPPQSVSTKSIVKQPIENESKADAESKDQYEQSTQDIPHIGDSCAVITKNSKLYAVKIPETTYLWNYDKALHHLRVRHEATAIEMAAWVRYSNNAMLAIGHTFNPSHQGDADFVLTDGYSFIAAHSDIESARYIPSQIENFIPPFRLVSCGDVIKRWLALGLTKHDVKHRLYREVIKNDGFLVYDKQGIRCRAKKSELWQDKYSYMSVFEKVQYMQFVTSPLATMLGDDQSEALEKKALKAVERWNDEIEDLYFDAAQIQEITVSDYDVSSNVCADSNGKTSQLTGESLYAAIRKRIMSDNTNTGIGNKIRSAYQSIPNKVAMSNESVRTGYYKYCKNNDFDPSS